MYSRHNQGAYGVQQFFARGHCPVTTALIVAAATHFVVDVFVHGRLAPWVGCALPVFSPEIGPVRYWTFLTYPIAQGAQFDFIYTAILCYWLWWVGGSLERSWGSAGFARFFVALTLVTSLALWVGARMLGVGYILCGLTLPVVGLTTAWAAINPYEELLFWMVIRMRAWILAAIVVAMMFFYDFHGAPVLGLFALANPLLGYLWVRGRMLGGLRGAFMGGGRRRGPDLRFSDTDRVRNKNRPLDDLRGHSLRGPLGAYKDWQQRRRLDKLWRDSDISDKKDEH